MFHSTDEDGAIVPVFDADRALDTSWYDDQRVVNCKRCGRHYAFSVVPARCPICSRKVML